MSDQKRIQIDVGTELKSTLTDTVWTVTEVSDGTVRATAQNQMGPVAASEQAIKDDVANGRLEVMD